MDSQGGDGGAEEVERELPRAPDPHGSGGHQQSRPDSRPSGLGLRGQRLMPNVPNLYAAWTYDEILITVPAQQYTPVV